MKKISLILQFMFALTLLILLVTSLFVKHLTPAIEGVTGLTLLTCAYNNQLHYKRKHMTAIYIIFGIIMICMSIFNIFNG